MWTSKNKKQTKQTKGGKKNNIFIRCWEWGWGGIFSAPDLFTLLLFYSLYLLKTCIKKWKVKSFILKSINPFYLLWDLCIIWYYLYPPWMFSTLQFPVTQFHGFLFFVFPFFLLSDLTCWTLLQINNVYETLFTLNLFILGNTSFLWFLSASSCWWLPNLFSS